MRPAEANYDFLRRFLPKLDWAALVDTARSLGDESLPDEMPEMWDDEMLQKLHHVLLEVSTEVSEVHASRTVLGSCLSSAVQLTPSFTSRRAR